MDRLDRKLVIVHKMKCFLFMRVWEPFPMKIYKYSLLLLSLAPLFSVVNMLFTLISWTGFIISYMHCNHMLRAVTKYVVGRENGDRFCRQNVLFFKNVFIEKSKHLGNLKGNITIYQRRYTRLCYKSSFIPRIASFTRYTAQISPLQLNLVLCALSVQVACLCPKYYFSYTAILFHSYKRKRVTKTWHKLINDLSL